MSEAEHHDPAGGFRNPWPTARLPDRLDLLRWWWERARERLAPDPGPERIPCADPRPARPRAQPGELMATWVGHATFLVQVGGLNVLTDPHFSERAFPVQWMGPRRFSPPGIALDDLPPVDAVLLSHDHYDHLDEGSVLRLHRRHGEALRWLTPLGYRDWFARRGIRITELDWWGEATLPGPAGELRVQCLPAQHWTHRAPRDRMRKLWSAWSVRGPGGRGVFFGGDSGWFPGFPEIGGRAGPWDLVLLPVGAYEPRWFMRSSHMSPEEAVRAYGELGGRGVLAAMHWGTFRLTDEDPLEPPERTRTAWRDAGLPEDRLWIPAVGETRAIAAHE